VLPFAAKIQELQGDVLGLGTDRASRAVAKLEGRVDEFGLARVDGSLATFDPKSFLDLRVAFRNVEMSPLSSYSATFAGRRSLRAGFRSISSTRSTTARLRATTRSSWTSSPWASASKRPGAQPAARSRRGAPDRRRRQDRSCRPGEG